MEKYGKCMKKIFIPGISGDIERIICSIINYG